MKLSELENIEIKVIEVPELIQVPEEVKDKFNIKIGLLKNS